MPNTYQALQAETQIKPNFLKNVQEFSDSLISGKWDYVLSEIDGMDLERETVMSLYETMSFELMDTQEWDMAKFIVKDLMVQRSMIFYLSSVGRQIWQRT